MAVSILGQVHFHIRCGSRQQMEGVQSQMGGRSYVKEEAEAIMKCTCTKGAT